MWPKVLAYFRTPARRLGAPVGPCWTVLTRSRLLPRTVTLWQWMLQGTSKVQTLFLIFSSPQTKPPSSTKTCCMYMIKGHWRRCPLRDWNPMIVDSLHELEDVSVLVISCSWVALTTYGAHYGNQVHHYAVVRSWLLVHWDRRTLTIK